MHGRSPAPVATLPCPHCGSGAIHKHGSSPLKDGTRQPRYLCCACGRTHNPYTGTPLSYLKKRDRWERFLQGMAQGLSLRLAAAALHVHVATVFSWRHRLMANLCHQPQPVLTGRIVAGEAFVRYSEKGNRRSDGPGAHGIRALKGNRLRWIHRKKVQRYGRSGERPFRRFIDGKPSCVLLACSGEQHAVVEVSSGRPTPEQLLACLTHVLGDGAEVWADGLAPYAEACRRLGAVHRPMWERKTADGHMHPGRAAGSLPLQLYIWLRPFRGVATKYLERYLSWYRCAGRIAPSHPRKAVHDLLIAARTRTPAGRPA